MDDLNEIQKCIIDLVSKKRMTIQEVCDTLNLNELDVIDMVTSNFYNYVLLDAPNDVPPSQWTFDIKPNGKALAIERAKYSKERRFTRRIAIYGAITGTAALLIELVQCIL